MIKRPASALNFSFSRGIASVLLYLLCLIAAFCTRAPPGSISPSQFLPWALLSSRLSRLRVVACFGSTASFVLFFSSAIPFLPRPLFDTLYGLVTFFLSPPFCFFVPLLLSVTRLVRAVESYDGVVVCYPFVSCPVWCWHGTSRSTSLSTPPYVFFYLLAHEWTAFDTIISKVNMRLLSSLVYKGMKLEYWSRLGY